MEIEPVTDLKTIPLDSVKGVLIDLDNTFYTYTTPHEQGMFASCEEYIKNQSISKEKFYALYKEAQTQIKQKIKNQGASHSRLLYFQYMTEQVEKRTNIQKSLSLEEVYWNAFQKAVVLRKDVLDFIQQCKEKSIKICVITDLTAGVQFRKMVALGIDTLADFIVTSEEAGFDKPHTAMFSLALHKLGLGKEDVIMIGDDVIKDIDGARTHNIKAYLV